ncbi:MAG: hypothetical protein ACQKBU_01520, partial [Verrucomicrobiales bacterium]
LEDYTLGGISKLHDGYFAVLIEKKDPSKKIVISPGEESDFEVVDVRWADNWRETVVSVRAGSQTGTVGFEEKFIEVKPAPAAKAPADAKRGSSSGAKTPPTPNNNSNRGGRTSRPRVVVPSKR